MKFWLKKNETSKHHDLASKRRKSHFRGLEFPRMAPDPPTGERLRRSYYRTPFCEILDPPQTLEDLYMGFIFLTLAELHLIIWTLE